MENKYFMHRIKKENGNYVKGIEVHDSIDSAVLSFWSYNVYAYNNPDYPDVTFVSCKITDINGNILHNYDMLWRKNVEGNNEDEKYFMHHIRKDGSTFNKDIDICNNIETARLAYSKAMAYGYNNPRHADVLYVSCMITRENGETEAMDTWIKPEEQ